MQCDRILQILSAYSDGELDARQTAEAEEHVRNCENCAAALVGLSALKTGMRDASFSHRAPQEFQNTIFALVDKAAEEPASKEIDRPRMPGPLRYFVWAVAAVLVIGVGLMVYVKSLPSKLDRLAPQAIAAHQRSLIANHLVDIASPDPTIVMNWLKEQSGLSPFVPVNGPPGYVLAGARMDYLDGRKVVALVYRNGEHVTNIFEWPEMDKAYGVDAHVSQGLGVAYWNNTAWSFYVVSDAGPAFASSVSQIFVSQGCGPAEH